MADERKIGAVELDRLYDFLDGLQASGYTIDPRQYLALSDLLMALIAHGDSLAELPLKTLIAPLICSAPSEQQDFYQRFDHWYTTLLSAKQVTSPPLPSQPKRRGLFPIANRTIFIWIMVIISLIALVIQLILNSPSINSNILPDSMFFVFVGLLVWIGWRLWIFYKENQYITRELARQDPVYTKVPIKAYIQEVMPVMKFKPIVSALRMRTQVPSSEVDVDRTIESALKRDNWLEIVYRQRQVIPEYVVLIDRKSRFDQQSRFVQEVLEKLAADGVWLHQYEFNGDVRICFPFGRKDNPLRLKDLRSRHPDSRLLIFSGANELINPLTGFLQDWLESLSHWQERAILTPGKLQKVLLEEFQSRDFAVLPMNFDGLASLVRAFETDKASLCINGEADMPTPLTERPTRWTGRDEPPETEVKALVNDLKDYLGENGFYWLCATAVYPELHWELTLHLGIMLKDEIQQPLFTINILIRLARLPWFRIGYMPDWIRLPLVSSMNSSQENEVRFILRSLLVDPINEDSFKLPTIVYNRNLLFDFIRQALSSFKYNSKDEESVYTDRIFLKLLVKKDKKRLSVKLPVISGISSTQISINDPGYICVLASLPDDNDIPYDPSPYMNGYRWKQHLIEPQNVEKQIRDLIDEGVNVFINLCDGTPDDALSGIAIVHALEKYNAAYTGADSKFLDPTRDEMKNAARRVSVPTPNWMFVNRVEEVEKVARRLKFPMLVKPPHGYASVGIRRSSRVENIDQLREQLNVEIVEFGRALVEEFIEGREFTCLIAENPNDPKKPLTFTPVEFIFPTGESFKHYDMKWVEYEKMSVATVNDPKIEKTLREQTILIFQEMDGNGYARCDYRMDADGVLYMLEINPNCGVFYPPHEPGSADFSLLNDPTTDHTKFMRIIIRNARNRRERLTTNK